MILGTMTQTPLRMDKPMELVVRESPPEILEPLGTTSVGWHMMQSYTLSRYLMALLVKLRAMPWLRPGTGASRTRTMIPIIPFLSSAPVSAVAATTRLQMATATIRQ